MIKITNNKDMSFQQQLYDQMKHLIILEIQ